LNPILRNERKSSMKTKDEVVDRALRGSIEVGDSASIRDLCRNLFGQGHDISQRARALLACPQFALRPLPERIDFYVADEATLGIDGGYCPGDIFPVLERIGAKKLPAEAIFQYLRHHFVFESMMLVYMEPMPSPEGYPSVFSVVCGETGVRIDIHEVYPGAYFTKGTNWMFGL